MGNHLCNVQSLHASAEVLMAPHTISRFPLRGGSQIARRLTVDEQGTAMPSCALCKTDNIPPYKADRAWPYFRDAIDVVPAKYWEAYYDNDLIKQETKFIYFCCGQHKQKAERSPPTPKQEGRAVRKSKQRSRLFDELDEASFDCSVPRLEAAVAAVLGQGHSPRGAALAEAISVLKQMKLFFASNDEKDDDAGDVHAPVEPGVSTLDIYVQGITYFSTPRSLQTRGRVTGWSRDVCASKITEATQEHSLP